MKNLPKLLATCLLSTFIFAENNPNNPITTSQKIMKNESTFKLGHVFVNQLINIDPKAIQSSLDEWKDGYSTLQRTVEPIDKELHELESKFEKGRVEFENLQKSGIATNEALQRKYEELARLEMELRKRLQERDQFVQSELTTLQAQISPKLEAILEEIRDEGNFNKILKADGVVLAADKKDDVTELVRQKANKQYAEEKARKLEASKKTAQAPA